MNNSMTGIVHGRTIQLDQEPGLPDGQQVIVSLAPAAGGGTAANAWAAVDQIRERLLASGRSFGDKEA